MQFGSGGVRNKFASWSKSRAAFRRRPGMMLGFTVIQNKITRVCQVNSAQFTSRIFFKSFAVNNAL